MSVRIRITNILGQGLFEVGTQLVIYVLNQLVRATNDSMNIVVRVDPRATQDVHAKATCSKRLPLIALSFWTFKPQ